MNSFNDKIIEIISNISSNSSSSADLSNYYTKDDVDSKINSSSVDLSNYYTKDEIDNLIFHNDYQQTRIYINNSSVSSDNIGLILAPMLNDNMIYTFNLSLTMIDSNSETLVLVNIAGSCFNNTPTIYSYDYKHKSTEYEEYITFGVYSTSDYVFICPQFIYIFQNNFPTLQ